MRLDHIKKIYIGLGAFLLSIIMLFVAIKYQPFRDTLEASLVIIFAFVSFIYSILAVNDKSPEKKKWMGITLLVITSLYIIFLIAMIIIKMNPAVNY
jgi:hypothetical protein